MARANTICADPRRPEIDAMILSGASQRAIAGHFDIPRTVLQRYINKGCPGGDLPPKEAVQKVIAEKAEARAFDGLEILKEALADLDTILRGAIKAESFGAAATAARGKIEIAKTLGIQQGGKNDGSALADALEKLGAAAWEGVEPETVTPGPEVVGD